MRAFQILGLSILGLVGMLLAQPRDFADAGGPDVKALQQRLTDAGCYAGAIDGQQSPALAAAIKACPTQDPMLRIETGMHTAAVLDVATDSHCTLAATASLDKTVRLWSIPSGRPIRTQRVPIDSGPSGLVYGVAVSPDGQWVAAGGVDSHFDIDHRFNLYLFDAATGTSVRRFPADGTVNHIAFSPDGRRIAVAQGTGGIRVFDIASGRLLMADRSYGTSQANVAFGPDGTLYAVAVDGLLRRYSPNLRRRTLARTLSGRQPMVVAVQPTGGLLAVGYADAKPLDIFDAASLHWLAATDTAGLGNGDFLAAAWSRDGQRLFAGGQYWGRFAGKYFRTISVFDPSGRRVGADVPAATNTIYGLATCGQGALFVSSDPRFGFVSQNGTATTLAGARTVDMRGKVGDAFTVSADGKQVRFGIGIGAADPVLFDLAAGTLMSSPAPVSGLAKPHVTGLDVTNWLNTPEPLLNGRPFFHPRDIGEFQPVQSYSLAVRADRSGFVLGMQNYLVAFNADGKPLWNQPPMGIGAAWGVNLAHGDDLIVVAADDGTIRWYRWSDGKELLALFVDAPTKRWVAWTPSGYYMASPGGEDLIGWHVNRGWNQAADFFPASRFRARFSRPDIVRRVLDTLDEDAAVKEANDTAKRKEITRPLIESLPPVIRIIDPADGTHLANGAVTLDYAYRSPSGKPVDRIDVLVNGRRVGIHALPLRPVSGDTETKGSINVTLTQRDDIVGLIAWSGDRAGEVARVRLAWDGAPAPGGKAHKLYALMVGVSKYVDPGMTLAYAAKDARDFAKALENQKGLYYADVQTRVITDRDVTRANLIAGLEWLEKEATDPDDVSVLFLAGHGFTDDKQTYWYFPSDANVDNVRANGVSQDEIRRSLEGLPGKVLWFLDTCHAGSAAKRSPVDINVLVNTVTSAESGGIVVFASSDGREVSVESSDWGNGAFTKAIVEGIEQGKAAFREGLVTTSSLDTFVESRVQELTGGKQNPVMERPPEEHDFPIAEVRKP